ncbi:hypothetical protein [Nocardioides sp.]|uniref:hypothetical protein n=1 Tax=Nocardioides sp. TaxID=35761 RepID=UPI0039E6275E
MVTSVEVEEILALGHELRSFEAKGPGDLSDKHFCAKIARAAMAMGNLRDGGLVCLGIEDAQLTAMTPGLSPQQLSEWSDYNNVHDALARYSEPPVAFHVAPLKLANGSDIVVLEVSEFDQVPHVCKKDYPGELQQGVVYVRPHGKPQSLAVPTAADMRELLDLAVTKGVREFIRRIGDAGLSLGAIKSVDAATRDAFAAEAEIAWADPSAVQEFILSKGHFDVSIRPSTFDPTQVHSAAVESLVVNNAVRLRGWPMPFVDHQNPIVRHGDWVGQDIEARVVPHSEAWRACESGQFLHRRVFKVDLAATDGQLQADAQGATGAVVVWEVLFYLIEVAEFAARMATTMGTDSISIEVSLEGIAGRQLISGDWNRELHDDYLIHTDRLEASETCSTAELLANPRGVGVALAQTLFKRFGLDLPDQVLIDWQEKTLQA